MSLFSANLGFLWADLPLADAIVKAKKAGFDAVECHFPYDQSVDDVNAALNDTGLSMLGLNTSRGNVDAGDNGVCAIPGRQDEAREIIDQAVDYAMSIGAANVHVMAGFASGEEAHQQFLSNLRYAANKIEVMPLNLLIEPLNQYDAPDYFISTTTQADSILRELGSERVKLMFDFYHVQTMQGNATRLFNLHLDRIGHVQFASVPDRGPPGSGELDYRYIFDMISRAGYRQPLGAEYKPVGATDDSLGWLKQLT